MLNSFDEVLNYLYSRLPMYQRQGKEALRKYDLEKIASFCAYLGNPQEQIRAIHVAGTNGKGSVCSMLAAVLLQLPRAKIGLYTSPHLQCFTERIKTNGQAIPKFWVVDFVNQHRKAIEQIEISFFELTCGMAFQYFAEQSLDWAVIETGLGGRLDSTNIVQPQISIITTIGYDHQDILGGTLAQIAFEKAGIIKKQTPVVIGQYHPETISIFEQKALEMNAPLFKAWEHFTASYRSIEQTLAYFDIYNNSEELTYKKLACDLPGLYQAVNIPIVLMALKVLNLFPAEKQLRDALANTIPLTGLKGRMQILKQKPLIIADGAHNAEGIQILFRQIQSLSYQKLHIILGVVKEKNLEDFFIYFYKNAIYYFTQPKIPRKLSCQDLQAVAQGYQLNGLSYSAVELAIQAAEDAANENDLILITGSLFVVAEALDYFDNRINKA